MKALKLYPNGLTSVVEMPKRNYLFQSMQEVIGCDCVEIVNSAILGEKYCMVCDEEFLLKNKPVVNPIASYLYGMKEHGQPLCGDVLVMKNKFTPDGIDTVGLENEDLAYIHGLISKNLIDIFQTFNEFVAKHNVQRA